MGNIRGVTVYLGQPGSQLHAHALEGMPVCISYANWSAWLADYQASWSHLLVDSGAFSVLNTGKVLDNAEYIEWAQQWTGISDAIACLDDIEGDYRKTIRNCESMPDGIGFPTYHETDPPEILPDLIELARLHGGWLGLGSIPPRVNKQTWILDSCERIPDDIHVHGWALRAYLNTGCFDSVDSTNWFRDSWQVRKSLPWLTPGECVDIMVKRYQREALVAILPDEHPALFNERSESSETNESTSAT